MTTALVAEETLDALADLVAATRRLMLAAATTAVATEDVERARRQVEETAAALEQDVRDHGVRRHLDRAAIARAREGEPWQVFGHNPLGVPLRITVEGEQAVAVLDPTPLLEGPPRLLHGGFSAAMLDALLSTLAQVQDRRVVTVRLDVSFLAAVPLDAPLRLVGELTRTEGRKTWAEGRIERAGEVVVRAEALLIEIPGEPD